MSPSPALAWVTGAGGLIGNYLVQLALECAPDWRVRGLTRADLDLTDFAAVRRASRRPPALVIHCAALSRSPECEANPSLARRVNVEVTRTLANSAPRRRWSSFRRIWSSTGGRATTTRRHAESAERLCADQGEPNAPCCSMPVTW